MKKELQSILCKGAKDLGAGELSEAQVTAFATYLEELKRWSGKVNLTAIRDDREIIIRHFIDSLVPFKVISSIKNGAASILDIGAGGGFPGIPLKIVLPETTLTLIDSVGKKVNFMRHAIRTIGLADAKAVAGRAEDTALIESVAGGGFDCVISRALTELKGFVEMARPYLSEDGTIIAMKGPLEDGASDTAMPLKAELKAVEAMGVGSVEAIEVAVPFTDRMTTLVILRGLSQRDNS